jgi:hypothetical protein
MQTFLAWLTAHGAVIQTGSQFLSCIGVFLAVVAIGVNAYQVRKTRFQNRATAIYNVYKDARDVNLKLIGEPKSEDKDRVLIWTALSVYASAYPFHYFRVFDRKNWEPLESDMKKLFKKYPSRAKSDFEKYRNEYDPRFVSYVRDFFRRYDIR